MHENFKYTEFFLEKSVPPYQTHKLAIFWNKMDHHTGDDWLITTNRMHISRDAHMYILRLFDSNPVMNILRRRKYA